MNLILSINPDLDQLGLLYDLGQDSSTPGHRRRQGVL